MTRVIFRCDASTLIGSGHIIRCRTLARQLLASGCEVIFVTRENPGNLNSVLRTEFKVITMPFVSSKDIFNASACDPNSRSLYSQWLGCDQAVDAHLTIDYLKKANIKTCDFLIIDHYSLGKEWEDIVVSGLRSSLNHPKVLVIDDLADREHTADILLDQNFFGSSTESRYLGLVPDTCLQLLGPRYALLAPEYSYLHPLMPVRSRPQRVLVYFGGADLQNLTAKAIIALSSPQYSSLEIDVVLGYQSPHRKEIEDLISTRPHIKLHDFVPCLAGLMARADLSIGAGGSTTWERACLGLPSIVFSLAANQVPFTEALHQYGYIKYLGSPDGDEVDKIRDSLDAIFQTDCALPSGKELCDGFGVNRLLTALLGIQEPIVFTKSSNTLIVNDLAKDSSSQKDLADDLQSTKSIQSCLTACDSKGLPLGQILVHKTNILNVDFITCSADLCVQNTDFSQRILRKIFASIGSNFVSAKPQSFNLKSFKNSADTTCNYLVEQPYTEGALPPSYVTILSDESSWLNPYLLNLVQALFARNHYVRWIHDPKHLVEGDVCLLLSCGKILTKKQLKLSKHNLVVHASDLPLGQGWSPMTWLILEGNNDIPHTLFEATAELDAGHIYLQKHVKLNGMELVNEWRPLQAKVSIELCLEWFDQYQKVISSARPQIGPSTYYNKRGPRDSLVDVNIPLAEQFQLLRVVDNLNYPAYFKFHGREYQLLIQSSQVIDMV